MSSLYEIINDAFKCPSDPRGGSRTAATSKMERVVIIVNGFQPLTIITKRSILDVAAALDPPLDPAIGRRQTSKIFTCLEQERFFQ